MYIKVSDKHPTIQVMMIGQVCEIESNAACTQPSLAQTPCPPEPVLVVKVEQCCRKAARKNHRTQKSLSVGKGATPEK
jgi:hypothetical protein